MELNPTHKQVELSFYVPEIIFLENNKIIKMYQEGVSSNKIADKFRTNNCKIIKILKDNNIGRRNHSEAALLQEHKPLKPESMHAKKDRGEITEKDYREYIAKNLGYKSWSDYANRCRHLKGTRRPLEKAKETGMYLGVYVAERILSKIFEEVQRMPNNNIGYDFLCKKGYKIDVKCSCLTTEKGKDLWFFNIRKNTIADYFLFLAFNSRNNLEPHHIWLINSNEPIPELRWLSSRNTRLLKNITVFRIPNTPTHLNIFERFEQIDKLDKLKTCCATLRS